MIDKIGNIGKIFQQPKNDPVKKAPAKGAGNDSVSISPEARQAAEVANTVKLVQNTPDDTRAEKLREVREKLKNGDYDQLSPEMLDSIADRVAPTLLSEE